MTSRLPVVRLRSTAWRRELLVRAMLAFVLKTIVWSGARVMHCAYSSAAACVHVDCQYCAVIGVVSAAVCLTVRVN